jgi:hypothetical protein
MEQVISQLAKTERNFKLQKDESTVELEKSRLESQTLKDAFSNVASIVKELKLK